MNRKLSLDQFAQCVADATWMIFKREPWLMLLCGIVVVFGSLFTLGLLAGPFTIAFVRIVRRRLRGVDAEFSDIWRLDHIFGGLLALLLLLLGSLCGLVLLVIPGLIVALFGMFTLHVMAYENSGPFAAIERSFAIVQAHVTPSVVLCVGLILLQSLASVVPLAGLVITPLSLIAMTVAFEILSGRASVVERFNAQPEAHAL